MYHYRRREYGKLYLYEGKGTTSLIWTQDQHKICGLRQKAVVSTRIHY